MEKIMMSPPMPGTPYIVDAGQIPSLLQKGWWEPVEESMAPTTEETPAGTTINVNTASLSDLTSLPGIGTAKAREVVKSRPYEKLADLIALDLGVDWASLSNQLSY
jgi:DNA uptake protein ComE-like DNA-binding protein